MQEAYCQSYIKTPENQTQAAINAGFSPNTAAVKASVMMRDERIKKRIAELMEERNKRMRVSADYVLMCLVEIDQMDVLDILNDDGGMKPIAEWPKVWRTSLSAMDIATIKTTQASLQSGGTIVKGHICFFMMSFSRSVNAKSLLAFFRAVEG